MKINFFREFHKKCPIYSNGFILNFNDNVATIWLSSSENEIQVVVQGPSPFSLLSKLQKMIEDTRNIFTGLQLSFKYFCPQCLLEFVQKKYEEKNEIPLFLELPTNLMERKFSEKDIEQDEGEYVICTGHRICKQAVKFGFAISNQREKIERKISEL